MRLDERVGHVDVVAVLGAGEEGCLLALQAALAGCAVRLYDPDPAILLRAQERIRASIEQGVAAGRLRPEDKQRALDGILATADLEEAVTHGDLVIEAGERTGAERRALFLRVGERLLYLLDAVGGEGHVIDVQRLEPAQGQPAD